MGHKTFTKVFYGFPVDDISLDDTKKMREEDESRAAVDECAFYNIGGENEMICMANEEGYIIYKVIADDMEEPTEASLLWKDDRVKAREMVNGIIERFPSLVVGKLSVVVVIEFS